MPTKNGCGRNATWSIADLDYKHDRMKKNAFVFLRATFFRWARRIETVCPDLAGAPAVLSVGDLHVENFGTWRDAEGRLVWGINDFDEAADIPYPFDLVRLATSALPGSRSRGLRTREVANGRSSTATARALRTRGRRCSTNRKPGCVQLVACSDKTTAIEFWREDREATDRAVPPDTAADGLRAQPAARRHAAALRDARRRAVAAWGGLATFAVAEWRGGRVAARGQGLVPSGWDWAHDRVSRLVAFPRSRSRYVPVAGSVSRCAATSSLSAASPRIPGKVEFGNDPSVSRELLTAMGFDLGAIHAADRRCDKVPRICDSARAIGCTMRHGGDADGREDFAKWSS